VSPPELLGDLAAAFLARTWHRPEGAHMPDHPDDYRVDEYDLRSTRVVVELDRPEDDPAPAEEATT
jgi:hypothetical protein